MKKLISPVLVFAAVFAICCIVLPYSIICKENLGLFIATPDYFRTMFSGSLPICNIIADFAAQFFRYKLIGPAIIAGIVTITFLLLRAVAARFALRADFVCALLAGASFFFIAKGKLEIGILALLISAALALLAMVFVKKGEKKGTSTIDTFLVAAVLAAACLIVCLNPSIKRTELWSRIEYGCYAGNWDLVTKTATPQRSEKDRMMIPFALLAYNCKGELGNKIFNYPIIAEEDLTTEGVNSFQGYFFSAILNRELGCANEVIHNLYQASCTFRHTTCFLTLRELVAEYYSMGNYTLARKYCDILSKSSSHKRYVKYFMDLMAGLEDSPKNSPEESASAGLIPHDPVSSLSTLFNEGINSSITMDRYLCHMLAQKDLTAFGAAFSTVIDYYEKVPRYYQEALAMLGIHQDKVDSQIKEVYARFALGTEEAPKDTYWYYINK